MGAFLNSMLHNSATFVFLLSLFWSTALFGQRVIFVNGIMNSKSDAEDSRVRIQEILDGSVNHPNNKRTFTVIKKWNPNGYTGVEIDLSWNIFTTLTDNILSLRQDKRELFMLKTAEEIYEDDFGQMLGIWGPGKTPIITSGTPNIDAQAAARVAAYADNMTNVDVSIKFPTSSPDTDVEMGPHSMDRTQQVVSEIVDDIILNGPAIVVAHSEGNLLANLAYAKLAARFGNDVRKFIVIVNLANTAKFSTNGFNLTHAGDGMLFTSAEPVYGGLENMPVMEDWYRNTPRSVWDYPALPPVRFEVMPPSFQTTDILWSAREGHSILGTYLYDYTVNPTPSTAASFNFSPDANRFRDRFEDFVYFAAASLDAANSSTLVYDHFGDPAGTDTTPQVAVDEHFTDTSLTAPWWQKDYALTQPYSTAIANNELVMFGRGGIARENAYLNQTFGPGSTFNFRAKLARTALSYNSFGLTDSVQYNYGLDVRWENSNGGTNDTMFVNRGQDGLISTAGLAYPLFAEQYYNFTINYGTDGIIQFFADGNLVTQTTTPVSSTMQFYVSSPHDPGTETHVSSIQILAKPIVHLSLNTAWWLKDYTQTQPNYSTIRNNELVMSGRGGGSREHAYLANAYGPGTRYAFRAKLAQTTQSGTYIGLTDITTYNYCFYIDWTISNGGSNRAMQIFRGADSTFDTRSLTSPLLVEQYHDFVIDHDKDGLVSFYADGNLVSKTTVPTMRPLTFFISSPHDPGTENKLSSLFVTSY